MNSLRSLSIQFVFKKIIKSLVINVLYLGIVFNYFNKNYGLQNEYRI